MSGNYKKEDLRIKKTYKSLQNALAELLERRSFRQITVNDICEEALISRAAFYAHFKDKYDLLEYCILEMAKDKYEYIEMESGINQLLYKENKVIKNLVADADNETMDLLQKFASLMLDKFLKTKARNDTEYIVLSNFCFGGILQLLLWQIRNGYPSEMQETSKYLCDLMNAIIDWVKK